MAQLTANPAAAAGQTLEELKKELGRLSSYTTELGTAREAAVASQQAASGVVALVAQLGDLQRAQLTALQADNEAARTAQQKTLAKLADEWSQRWREEAAKSLSALDGAATTVHQAAHLPQEAAELLGLTIAEFVEKQQAHQQAISTHHQSALHSQQTALEKQFADWLSQLTNTQETLHTRMRAASDDFVTATKAQGATLTELISRQQQLAVELAAFRDAMKQAIRFAEALEAVKAQSASVEAAVKKEAATANAAFQQLGTSIKQQGATLHEALQRDVATQTAAFKAVTTVVQQQHHQLNAALEALLPKLAQMRQAIAEAETRTAQQNKDVLQLLAEQHQAQEAARIETQAQIEAVRKEARIWQVLTLLAALGAIAAGLLHS